MNYTFAKEVEEVAQPILTEHHNELTPVRIFYLFTDEPIKKKGKHVLGEIKKITGMNAFLANSGRGIEDTSEFLVMLVHKETWDFLEPHQRKALVDHELTHATVSFSSGKIEMRPHDLEEFNIIVARHGLWMTDVDEFIRAYREPTLFQEHYEKERADAAVVAEVSAETADRLEQGLQEGLRDESSDEDSDSTESFGDKVADALEKTGLKVERNVTVSINRGRRRAAG